MKKSVTLIAGSNATRMSLERQISETIPNIIINSFAIDEEKNIQIKDNVVILSSYALSKELQQKGIKLTNKNVIVAGRSISYDYIEEIVLIPENTEVLLVNDCKESSIECIENIKRLGINHIKIHPYYPNTKEKYDHIQIAITPGEVDKVPKHIKTIHNIETRIIDFFTITKIIYQLELFEENYEEASYKYLLKIVNIAKRLSKANNDLTNMNFHLNTVIGSLNKGYILYDHNGVIKVFNDKFKSIINIKQRFIVENKIENIFKQKNILDFLYEKEQCRIEEIKYNNKVINIEKIKLNDESLNLGIFECIREEKTISENLLEKGLVAKYSFDDIVGNSVRIKKSKDIASKLACSELTILIHGESGTGKELFASSIHRNSKRKNGPFLAVNFSALPEDLLESQLFGYEDGAFTGAKKGGKKGLFEEANGGTIFLDEIGDISMKVQTRLLRVLQEKEIMRVGSNKIIDVDVRIIAATNRDLEEMISKNEFREDLYYRLKMGYVSIPPLRERSVDITELVKYFIHCETKENIILDEDAFKILRNYNWLGNVRELKNAVSYMIAIRDTNCIGIDQLPEYILSKNKNNMFTKTNNNNKLQLIDFKKNHKVYDKKLEFILREIYELTKKGEVAGREKISIKSKEKGIDLSVSQVRTKLDKLEKLGYIEKSKGRNGTKLTEIGELILNGEYKVDYSLNG